jgi:hypothetical protein
MFENSTAFRLALKGLTVISNELADDSDPSALQIVGDGLVRDLQIRLDSPFFGNTVAHGPNGLESLTGVQTVDAASLDNLDAFAEALSKAEHNQKTAQEAAAARVLKHPRKRRPPRHPADA